METHYTKHHAAYTKNLNDVAEKAGIAGKPSGRSVRWKKTSGGRQDGRAQQRGGFFNHNLYFDQLARTRAGTFRRARDAIKATSAALRISRADLKGAVGQFGSGWAWLATDADGKLKIMASPIRTIRSWRRRASGGRSWASTCGARLLPEVQKPSRRLREGVL